MTSCALEEILAFKDVDKICEEMERRGFRRAGENWDLEYDRWEIQEESAEFRAIQKDKIAEREYHGTLYTNCKKYEGFTFVLLNVVSVKPYRGKRIPVPLKVILFTDAPYDEEYVKGRNAIVQCGICGKECPKKELRKRDEMLLCANCLSQATDRSLVRALLEEIEKLPQKRSVR